MKIKFKAWDKKRKNFREDICLSIQGETFQLTPLKNNKDIELIQYTGLLDKNGKEIFIGDILNWDDKCTILLKEKDELGFYYEVLTQKDKNICAFDIRFYRSEESAEIIGDKFEKIIKKEEKMSTNNQLIILKEGNYFCIHEDACVDNPFEQDKESLIGKKDTLVDAIKFAKEYCNENLVEYGYSISDSALEKESGFNKAKKGLSKLKKTKI